MEREDKTHESFGMISISRYSCNHSEFFGSDIVQNGGISISISKASVNRHLSSEWFHSGEEIIRVDLSANQYVDAISSGMNTSGVPCTIRRLNGSDVENIQHVTDKKSQFKTEMADTQQKFKSRIDDIILLLDGNVGKKKKDEVVHSLNLLRSHISSNTDFVLASFDEAMDKTVMEAKQSISNYVDHKVTSLGIEGLRNQLSIELEAGGDIKKLD